MPEVVSNSSPLIHLAKMGQLDLLHEFFGEIAIPRAVAHHFLKTEKLCRVGNVFLLPTISLKPKRIHKDHLIGNECRCTQKHVCPPYLAYLTLYSTREQT